ncbi:MAG: hypothetical protein M1826_004602 [Phylliscum demangeonii]|nr:MAG: hypothetical protein M1826_004602 [Phylliscum demangeonii]
MRVNTIAVQDKSSVGGLDLPNAVTGSKFCPHTPACARDKKAAAVKFDTLDNAADAAKLQTELGRFRQMANVQQTVINELEHELGTSSTSTSTSTMAPPPTARPLPGKPPAARCCARCAKFMVTDPTIVRERPNPTKRCLRCARLEKGYELVPRRSVLAWSNCSIGRTTL